MPSPLKKTIFSIILFFGLSHQQAHGMKEFFQEYPLAIVTAIDSIILLGSYNAFSYYMDPAAPWYLHFPLAYKIGNQLTDLSQFINSRILFAQLRNSGLTKKEQVQWCKEQLHDIKQQLLNTEQSITTKILTEIDIDPQFYQEKLLNPWLQFNKKIATTDKIPGATHDETLDEFTINIIKKLLLKHDLNPDCYTIQYSAKYNCYAFYQRALYQQLTVTESLTLEIDVTDPPTIGFTPGVYTKIAKSGQYACIAHEITHVQLQHPEKLTLLNFFIKQIEDDAPVYESIKKKERMIKTIHERQAEIFPSVDDSTISSCMRSFRKDDYYPGHLYVEHYNTLSTINELHKIIQWIHTTSALKKQSDDIPLKHQKLATPVIPCHRFTTNTKPNKRLIQNKLAYKYQCNQLKQLTPTRSFGEQK